VQIAGLIARRILSWSREGQDIGAGERFGMIRFGSRLDVYLPEGVRPLVAEGQTAIAGETIIADLRAGDPQRAAIASRRAAEIYGGSILQSHLEDHRENYTRFALLSPEPGEAKGANKISLVVFLLHQPGALHKALEPLARAKINLVKIESRPIVGHPFEYCFYLDLMASPEAEGTQAALEELRRRTREVRVLGYYVAAPRPAES